MLLPLKHQGSIAEKSSSEKLNQGASRECAEYHSRGSFFVLFWTSKKEQKNKCEAF